MGFAALAQSSEAADRKRRAVLLMETWRLRAPEMTVGDLNGGQRPRQLGQRSDYFP